MDMKKFLLFLMSLCPLLSMGQTTLSPGDIIIVAINGDTDVTYGRGFSFMPLVNLEAGTEIYFTDTGWSDVTGSFINYILLSDLFIKYTAPAGGVTAGTVIRNATNLTTDFSYHFTYASADKSSYKYLDIVSAANCDEVLVFQGSIASPTFIFAASYVSNAIVGSGWATSVPSNGVSGTGVGSALPGTGNASVADLVDDVTALSFNQAATGNDNCAYTGVTTATDKAGWQARVSNYSNWTFSETPTPIPTPMSGSYTVVLPNSAPTDIALSATSINENVSGNSVVGALSSTDPDVGNTFTYTLVSGTGSTDNASFNISGSSLRITNSPNYEAKSSYSVRVRTTDQGGLWYEEAFTITINNLNETPTDISLSATSINENVSGNSVVGALSSTDPDVGNTFTYTLVSGTGSTDNASFNISGSSLRITSSPNYEAKSSYSVRVRTTDQGGLWYEEAFTITINDVSEPPTVTTQAVSAIAATTATGNGNITSLGSANPTAYGVCYGTTANPDITGSKVDKGAVSVTGTFVASMTGLTANTTYHVRAYATNTAGTSYGNDVTFKTLTPGTWTGNANSSYWTDANNWAGGTVPTSTTDVTIPSSGITYLPMIFATDNAECNNLTLADGFLEILSTSSGTGSLIVHGTASGKVWTDVYLAVNQWHVVAPPANNADISLFISYNSNSISSKVNGATTTYAIADYNENGNAWNSYFTDATSGTFTSGKGYSMRHDDDNYIAFYGDLITGNKTVTLTKTGEGWNCIGNPYTSAIGMNSSAGTASNFLGVNSGELESSYACVYVWDPTTTSYKIIGGLPSGLGGERSLGQDLLQAGQGFFVKAASAGASINFTPAMQTHSTGTVLKSAEAAWPGFELTASASGVKASTVVAFNSAMTKGLDPTYDAGLLRASNGLSLYTKLIDDNGVDFAIQCLPENGMENFVIPVGLDAKAGGEVKFNATCTGLPTGSSVILEDRTAKVYTDLSNGADYVVTLSANSSGTGRFYIHTSNLTTGTSDLLPSGLFRLKAYPADGVIWIDGHVSSKAVTRLYDARGSQIGRYNLEEGNRNSIPASGLTSGVYILKVIDGNNTFATKLVLVSNL
jgi:hypothetical protein